MVRLFPHAAEQPPLAHLAYKFEPTGPHLLFRSTKPRGQGATRRWLIARPGKLKRGRMPTGM